MSTPCNPSIPARPGRARSSRERRETRSARVAHDINNPLGAVKGNLVYAREELSEIARKVRSGGLPSLETLLELEDALSEASEGAERIQYVVTRLLCAARPPAAAGPSRGGPPATGLRILIVDDEVGIRHALRRMLGRQHRVEMAESGREALARVTASERFDVILCDLMMPEMTGMQLFEALTAEAPDAAARVVFMTGGVFTEPARQFLDRLSNPVLQKPVTRESLRAAFDLLLESPALHEGGPHSESAD